MSGKRMDIAFMIWEVMKEYAQAKKPKVNLPYAHLVTKICLHNKVKGIPTDVTLPSEFGPIDK